MKFVACWKNFMFGGFVGLALAAISRAAQFHNFNSKISNLFLHQNVYHIFLHKPKAF